MKKTLLMLVILATLSFSCSKSETDVTPQITKSKEYTINLGMNIQEVDVPMESSVTKVPMRTAAESEMKNLYGIQVYSYPASESHVANNNSYCPYIGLTAYAYGLFNDKNKMSIKMLEGYKYIIVVKCIIDGIDKIKKFEGDSYGAPFCFSGNNNNPKLDNSFKYSTSLQFRDVFYSGQASLTSGTSIGRFNCLNVGSYYGVLENYLPSENGNLELNLKRADFGVKYIIENLTQGSLKVQLGGTDQRIISKDTKPEVLMYTYHFTHPTYTDGYSKEMLLSIYWTKEEGNTPILLYSGKLKFKTRTIKNITFKVADTSGEEGISLNIDDSDFENEDVTIN